MISSINKYEKCALFFSSFYKQVASIKTLNHVVDVYDIIDTKMGCTSSLEDNLNVVNTGCYHTSQDSPSNRMVFLDGNLYKSSLGFEAFHEAFVHPGMFAHLNGPMNVLLATGGGDGGILREVLKHNTVEHVVVFEPDAILMNACKDHLPELSDCSNLAGSSDGWCYNNAKVQVIHRQDFLTRFLNDEKDGTIDNYDIAIADYSLLLSHESDKHLVWQVLKGILQDLNDDGILILKLDKDKTSTLDLIQNVQNVNHGNIHCYDEVRILSYFLVYF